MWLGEDDSDCELVDGREWLPVGSDHWDVSDEELMVVLGMKTATDAEAAPTEKNTRYKSTQRAYDRPTTAFSSPG